MEQADSWSQNYSKLKIFNFFFTYILFFFFEYENGNKSAPEYKKGKMHATLL